MIESIQEIRRRSEEGEKSFWEVIMEDDCSERGIQEKTSIADIEKMWQAMKDSDEQYDPALKSASGMIGGEGAKMEAYAKEGEPLCGEFMAGVMARALKVASSNACMKRIVAAPTAGSCGVLPAVLISLHNRFGFSDKQMVRALYVAGGIGGVIAARASLAGAEGGCQAEVGSASAMAAGAAVYLMEDRKIDHDNVQTVGVDYTEMNEAIGSAVALSLKNLLGLACDPVAGLVEVPCVKRNVIGAMNAMSAADMAIAGIRSVIPPDEVIDAMGRVGRQLPEGIRETALGGMAMTPTGMRIKKEFLGG